MSEELLIRFLTRRCTSDEIRKVDEWVAEDKANADWLFEMERIWSLKDELRFSDKKMRTVALYPVFRIPGQEKKSVVRLFSPHGSNMLQLSY